MKLRDVAWLVGLVLLPGIAHAQEDAASPDAAVSDPELEMPAPVGPPKPESLGELLDLVERGFSQERERARLREERFRREKDEQTGLLDQALRALAQREARSQVLEARFAENEKMLAELEANLQDRLGTMGELFGVVRQVAGDLQGLVWESVTSSQLPDRKAILSRLGRSTELPTTEDLEKLWFELHREMTEQGMIVRYPATILTTEGTQQPGDVIRAGVFSVIADGRYVHWDAEIQSIRELNRQPPTRYLDTVADYEEASGVDYARLAIDPSRGALLAALIDTPSRVERIQQGGPVGYVIIAIGALALAVGIAKWITLAITARRVEAQRKRTQPSADNPLGRVLQVYADNPDADAEALELRLDQAVLGEAERLDRFVWLVRVVSVVAPLLGLLGTVTGMIQTFQAITLFGAGDPKMMAGGISEALVTTMLGLVTAAPLVLLSAFLGTSRKRILSVLNGQSAGLVASRVEQLGV